VDVIAALGPAGVALAMAADNILPVIPSEVVLPFAGYLTAQGRMSFWVAALMATVGSTASAYVYYEVGRRLGPDRARAVLLRIPLTDGGTAVLTGRFIPLVRSLISLPAGTERMGRVRFGVLTTIGSAIWNVIWLALGRAVGQRWRSIGEYSDWINWGFTALVGGTVLLYVWKRRDRIGALSSSGS
jgi:membrane protein DedA with SNARE-associated domain